MTTAAQSAQPTPLPATPVPAATPAPDNGLSGISESDLLDALLDAEQQTAEEYLPFTVSRIKLRNGQPMTIRLRPVSDRERQDCVRKSARFRRDQRLANLAVAEERDDAAFNSYLIVMATHPDDRAALWESKAIQAKFKVFSAPDLVDKVLSHAGEKLKAVAAILDLSGLGSDDAMEEVASKS